MKRAGSLARLSAPFVANWTACLTIINQPTVAPPGVATHEKAHSRDRGRRPDVLRQSDPSRRRADRHLPSRVPRLGRHRPDEGAFDSPRGVTSAGMTIHSTGSSIFVN